MFSGKTTRLIQIYKKYTYIGKKVAVLNYLDDVRYHDTMLSTHDRVMIPCILLDDLKYAWNDPAHLFFSEIHTADVILINEGQFFEDLFDVVLEMVEKENKEVYICGLDGDFQRNVFGELLKLIPYCDSIDKLTSLCSNCRDGTPGLFSYRISSEKEQRVIGADNYVPLCRDCYRVETRGSYAPRGLPPNPHPLFS